MQQWEVTFAQSVLIVKQAPLLPLLAQLELINQIKELPALVNAWHVHQVNTVQAQELVAQQVPVQVDSSEKVATLLQLLLLQSVQSAIDAL